MTLRDVYLAVLERTPAPLQPVVRGSATGVRRTRRAVRRTRRRAGRWMSRSALTTEAHLRRTDPGRRFLSWLHTAQTRGPLGWMRSWLLRPLVHIAGVQLALVDATGVSSSDAVALLPMHTEGIVLVVDDPDLGPVRAAGVIYEYVPRDVVEGGGLGADSPRMLHFRRAYDTAPIVRIEDMRPAERND